MARLIIGDGQTRSAQHDANIFTKIFGTGTLIAPGEMKATKPDNNTIRIGSGMAICEGRAFENEIYDDFSIPTGVDGRRTTYFLGYRIYQDSDGEKIEKYISTSNHAQGSLAGGDSEMYAMLYSVVLNGINLGNPVALCEEIPEIDKKNTNIEVEKATATFTDTTANNQKSLTVYLEKKNGFVFCNTHNVLDVKTSKTVTLSGTIPAGYRPSDTITATATLINNSKKTGDARVTIDRNGVFKYVANATGWQEFYFSTFWPVEEVQ